MSKNRRLCLCGSGKPMRRCCGASSSPAKLNLEKSAKNFAEAGMHHEAAVTLLERARLSPQNPMIWNDLGVEYAAAGQREEARRAFERARKAFPDYPLPLYNLARLALGGCLERTGAARGVASELAREAAMEAVRLANESLSKDAALEHAHALLSIAYEALGEESRAEIHGREAAMLKGGSSAAETRGLMTTVLHGDSAGPNALRDLPFLLSSGAAVSADKL